MRKLILGILILGITLSSADLPRLKDITKSSGITFKHNIGDLHLSNIVESTGAGVCLFDYNNDGHIDIYFVNGCFMKGVSHPRGRKWAGKLTNQLYQNNGDGTFTDVTTKSGTGDQGYGMGCCAGDIDNDGDRDLFVTNYGPNRLFRNNGDGTFTDITRQAGVEDPRWSVGCTFLDYDRDGHLDLYVGNYLKFDPKYKNYFAAEAFPGPLAYPGVADALYRNKGNGQFEEVSQQAGITSTRGRAMGVSACDLDDDGYTDIFVANDGMENYLYHNQGKGVFKEIALASGVGFGQNGDATSAMGPEFGDYNRDGKMDVLVPDMGYSCLYQNLGKGLFEDMSHRARIALACGQYTSWSGNFFDFDMDGWLDIFLSNGDSHHLEAEEDLLLLNQQGKRFQNVSGRLGPDFQQKFVGRGSAIGDFDNDGDLDILVLNLNQRCRLLRNDRPKKSHWIMIELKGKRNADALGARVQIITGKEIQTRCQISSSGYLSQSDHRLHFGLGSHKMVDKIIIRWQKGAQTVKTNIPANQKLVISEEDDV